MTEPEINHDLEMLCKECNYNQKNIKVENSNQTLHSENGYMEETKIETSGGDDDENAADGEHGRKKSAAANNKYRLRKKTDRLRYENST